MLRQWTTSLTIRAESPGMTEITRFVAQEVESSAIETGLCTLFCRHTSASLLIQENAAPAARRDLERFVAQLAPEDANYEHDDEGPDDMPAHLRSALTATQLSIPIIGGRLALGRWQGIFLFEHRSQPTPREIAVHLMGE